MRIHIICAARPNFMKIAPLYHALKKEDWAEPIIVHTGQHYDLNLSDVIFQDLGLPKPDIHLGVGSGTHAEQTGKVMAEYEKIIMGDPPDLIVVVGDVNSTMAVTIAASKLGIKVAHLEAGLRSFDRTMPEEINRLVTDVLADILWTPSEDAVENLTREGISPDKIQTVGNIMIDSLEMLREKIEQQTVYKEFDLEPNSFGLVTLHRPANVDNLDTLEKLCKSLVQISRKLPLVFPIHPRTRKNLEKYNLLQMINSSSTLLTPDPLSYIRFMNMVFNCRLVITDSGGIQEETTYLGIPCLTVRPNTERPVTITQGTNQLCKVENLEKLVDEIFTKNDQPVTSIQNWDGNTAGRIVNYLKSIKDK